MTYLRRQYVTNFFEHLLLKSSESEMPPIRLKDKYSEHFRWALTMMVQRQWIATTVPRNFPIMAACHPRDIILSRK